MPEPGYHGRPLLKPPVWTWEIPVYLFAGGIAGGTAVLAWGAALTAGAVEPGAAAAASLVRTALRVSFAATVLSTVLLVLDLGRPARFLHMLRVFKWRSPMSVGVWTLVAFGASVTLALLGAEALARGVGPDGAARSARALGLWLAAPFGALVATYTGVLLGATVVPAWNAHRRLLPFHFGTAGLGSAAGLLELLGHQGAGLWTIGLAAAAVETVAGLVQETARHGAADRALRRGRAALLLRGGLLLAGPLALALRPTGLPGAAATAFLIGAFLNRFGWIEAGRRSARDPDAALARYA